MEYLLGAALGLAIVLFAAGYGCGAIWLWTEKVEPLLRRRSYDRIRRDVGYSVAEWEAEFPEHSVRS